MAVIFSKSRVEVFWSCCDLSTPGTKVLTRALARTTRVLFIPLKGAIPCEAPFLHYFFQSVENPSNYVIVQALLAQ